jgi:sugar O-acyltransferase (sialic acid O-acetyltransferase NeuD family)
MAKLVVFGAGDIAKLAHFYFTRDSPHDVVGFTVDHEFCAAESHLGLPLVDFERVAERFPPSEHEMFVALSYARMNKARAQTCERAKSLGYRLATYVSSRCTFLSDTPAGENCFILEDNTIQPFVEIGNDVTLWSGNHIGHDSVIEDHCFITSHVVVSGHCRVGRYSFIGVNATLRNSITLAPETLVAAGAVMMKNSVPRGVYVPKRAELFDKTSDQMDL